VTRHLAAARALPLAVLLLLVLLPAAAFANANVSRTDASILVEDDDGDVDNAISLTDSGADVLVHDANADVFELGGCDQVDARTVSCPTAPKVVLNLGGGGDILNAGGSVLPREASGEEGGDLLWGGADDDVLDGGAGNDVLHASEGDDEFIGGADRDDLTYASYEGGQVTVVLPDPGSAQKGNGDEDVESDTVHGDIEDVTGGGGDDTLVGNGEANQLIGENLDGAGGDDRLVAGGGTIDGGGGDDVIAADNDLAELSLVCGSGTDQIDHDGTLDPYPSGCETIAPEFLGEAFLENVNAIVGGDALLRIPAMLVQPGPPTLLIEWVRCEPCETVSISDNLASWHFEPQDEGHTFHARVSVSNAAGSDTTTTQSTDPIRPAAFTALPPPPPPPVLPPTGYRDYGDYADYADYADLFELDDALASWARRLLGRLLADTRDPRKLARRRVIPHPFVYPYDGNVTMTWGVVPPRKARAAAAKPLVIAKGSRKGKRGQKRTVSVRLTKRGRAILRRAKRLKVTLKISFVGGPLATKARPATVRRTFVLRRKRA
jgi:Ca2+-binding RTX toxin-like protein